MRPPVGCNTGSRQHWYREGREDGRREMLWLMAIGAGCAEVIWARWARIYADRMWTAAAPEKRAMSRYAGHMSEEALRALGVEP